MDTAIYPERICSKCGRFVVIDYEWMRATHVIGGVYDPWKKEEVFSAYASIAETQKHYTQEQDRMVNGKAICYNLTEFTKPSLFNKYLRRCTIVVHVNSEVDWFTNRLMMVKWDLLSLECVFTHSMQAPYAFLMEGASYRGNAFGLVPKVDCNIVLRNSWHDLAINHCYLYTTAEYWNWLFYFFLALRESNMHHPKCWSIVRCYDIDRVWKEYYEIESKDPTSYDLVVDPVLKADMTSAYLLVAASLRRLREYHYFSEEWGIKDLGGRYDTTCPAYRSPGDVKSWCYAYCDAICCPYCDCAAPGYGVHLQAIGALCAQKGTIVGN